MNDVYTNTLSSFALELEADAKTFWNRVEHGAETVGREVIAEVHKVYNAVEPVVEADVVALMRELKPQALQKVASFMQAEFAHLTSGEKLSQVVTDLVQAGEVVLGGMTPYLRTAATKLAQDAFTALLVTIPAL